jgi:hypothetical protein
LFVNFRSKIDLHDADAQSWVFAVVGLLMLLHWQPSSAQPAKPESAVGEPAQASVQSGPNAMSQAVFQRGMLSCAARVEQVTKFLGFGPQAGGHLMPPPAPADQRLFSLQLEVPAGAAGNSFVDMSFAPGQANGCGATYQTVTYWPQNCEAVGSQQFANFKPSQALVRDVTVLAIGPLTKVFLMKAGTTGCISIKKEIVL